MTATAQTKRLSHEEIIARFVEAIREEFARTESLPEGEQGRRPAGRSVLDYPKRRVAEWDGCSPLLAADFLEVECRELNAEGISFWMEHPPATPFVVLQIEVNGEVMFIKSRLLHANPDLTVDNARYLVAAKFSGRVDPGFQAQS